MNSRSTNLIGEFSYISENYVRYYKGSTPLILLSVHGGNEIPPDLNKRTCSEFPERCDCETNSDLNTIEIIEKCVRTLLEIRSVPYVIIGDIDRLYIDFNRDTQCAYIDQDAKKYYDTLHGKIREFVDDVRSRYNTAFLFDIHGTRGVHTDLWDVYIGTRNGNIDPINSSVRQLLEIDRDALSKLRRLFTDKGYSIQPSKTGERESYQGGYNLKMYGSNNSNGINAIQFEIDDNIRNDQVKRDIFAYRLAHITAKFVGLYKRKIR